MDGRIHVKSTMNLLETSEVLRIQFANSMDWDVSTTRCMQFVEAGFVSGAIGMTRTGGGGTTTNKKPGLLRTVGSINLANVYRERDCPS